MKASNSGSNLSRPSSSKSKPGTPKTRSKSKPHDREFMLWIPEPLENLENIIQSKQRTLDLLNYQTETLDKEVQDQLLARDRHISELNRKILDLRSSMKAKESNKNEKDLEKELEIQEKVQNQMKRENEDYKNKISDLERDFEGAIREWDEEKENLEIMNHALEDEEEGLKGSLEAKEIEIIELTQGMEILQSAVEKLTKLNSDLISNLDKSNAEIQILNTKFYDANIKASRAAELQSALEEYMELNRQLEIKNSKLMNYVDALAKFIKVSEWVGDNITKVEEEIKGQQEVLNNANETNIGKEILNLKFFLEDTWKNLSTIKSSMVKGTPKINQDDASSTEELLRKRNTELEIELKQAISQLNDAKSSENVYLNQIDSLKSQIELSSLEYKNLIMKMKNQMDSIKDVTEKFNERIQNFKGENEKNLVELYSVKSKLSHLTANQDKYNEKRKEFKVLEEKLRSENTEMKNKIAAFTNERRQGNGKGSLSEELRIKKAMSQLQILRDELFRKDTDLVKKAREAIKLENEIESQKTNVQKLHSKMKSIEADIISKVSQDLEEKDRQIEILKEMLRCAHSDIKFKDSQINSLKNNERMTSPKRK